MRTRDCLFCKILMNEATVHQPFVLPTRRETVVRRSNAHELISTRSCIEISKSSTCPLSIPIFAGFISLFIEFRTLSDIRVPSSVTNGDMHPLTFAMKFRARNVFPIPRFPVRAHRYDTALRYVSRKISSSSFSRLV